MKEKFEIGDEKVFAKIVRKEDIASFESVAVHQVYSTFALCRDAEWAGRLFVLDMKDADEEGIGTFVNITHSSPAFIGEEVCFRSIFKSLNKNEIITSFTAKVQDREIATGETGQKILKREKLNTLFNRLNKKADGN